MNKKDAVKMILDLSINVSENSEKFDIGFDYYGGTKGIEIRISEKDKTGFVKTYDAIYLDWENSESKLQEIISELNFLLENNTLKEVKHE